MNDRNSLLLQCPEYLLDSKWEYDSMIYTLYFMHKHINYIFIMFSLKTIQGTLYNISSHVLGAQDLAGLLESTKCKLISIKQSSFIGLVNKIKLV